MVARGVGVGRRVADGLGMAIVPGESVGAIGRLGGEVFVAGTAVGVAGLILQLVLTKNNTNKRIGGTILFTINILGVSGPVRHALTQRRLYHSVPGHHNNYDPPLTPF